MLASGRSSMSSIIRIWKGPEECSICVEYGWNESIWWKD
jgi:hypothetical protein